MKLGIVADDNTGATDAAGMLTERGVKTVLFVGVPSVTKMSALAASFDAAAIGTDSRSIAPSDAFERTRVAVEALGRMGARKIQVKYCSTFDSTPQGNIGQTLDAAMDCLKVPGTIVCPALPVNGRTTYCGYHFVGGQLLSESPLRNHPLNPMTDANLCRWLQHQTTRRVSSIQLKTIRQGVDALRAAMDARFQQGDRYLVTDALEDSDLRIIAQATVDWPLISGGSGITAELPGVMFPKAPPLSFASHWSRIGGKTLVVAGSCSPATRAQNTFALEHGFAGVRLNGMDILEGRVDPHAVYSEVTSHLARGRNVLVYSSADPKEVQDVQACGKGKGLTAAETGVVIGALLAEVGSQIIAHGDVGRVVISGGETSGSFCKRMNFAALEVGLPIEPGVPYCFPIDGPRIALILKSGNFGSSDLYAKVASVTTAK